MAKREEQDEREDSDPEQDSYDRPGSPRIGAGGYSLVANDDLFLYHTASEERRVAHESIPRKATTVVPLADLDCASPLNLIGDLLVESAN